MKNINIYLIVASFATLFALPLWGEEVCDPFSPHQSANNCRSDLCPPGDTACLTCCNDTCALCHSAPVQPPDFLPTVWNPDGALLTEHFPEETASAELTPADACQNCHTGHDTDDRFSSETNHPVEISYPKQGRIGELLPAPEGPLLVCLSSSEECKVRCITCHNVHSGLGEIGQTAALLRMDNHNSALCTACHVK